jgi:hypothetical protein
MTDVHAADAAPGRVVRYLNRRDRRDGRHGVVTAFAGRAVKPVAGSSPPRCRAGSQDRG